MVAGDRGPSWVRAAPLVSGLIGIQTQGSPTGTQIEVRLYSVGSSTLVDSNFNVVVY